MNCPTCGAENEADARFCAECGTPLEGQADQALAGDDDRTIMSSVSEISEEAKTVAVTQEDVANLAAEMEKDEEAEVESDTSVPPPSPPTGGNGGGSEGLMTQRNIIIAIVVLLVLCCCCFAIAIIVGFLSNEDILREFTFIRDLSPALLTFV